MTVYGKVRGSILIRSVQMLKEHQRSVSGGSVQGFQMGTNSPMLVSFPLTFVLITVNYIIFQRPKFQTRHEATRKPSTRRLQHV